MFRSQPEGLTRAYETILYAHMLCRLGLEPGLDYHESVRILENAKKTNPELEHKIDDAIEYAMYMCSYGGSFSDKHGSS